MSGVAPMLIAALLLAAAPVAAGNGPDNGHSGVARPRTAPELSDIALFGMAAGGIWFTRRALRKRRRDG